MSSFASEHFCVKNIYPMLLYQKVYITNENGLEAKENISQFQKGCYFRDQLTEIFLHRVEPQKLFKKGAP